MKKILAIGLIAIGGAWAFGKKKLEDYSKDLEQLTVKLAGIRSFKLSDGFLTMYVTLDLINPTATNFSLNTGGYIKLTKIRFFDKNKNPLGVADTSISQIQLKPNSFHRLKDIHVRVRLKHVADGLRLLNIFKNLDQLKSIVTLEAFGNQINIESK